MGRREHFVAWVTLIICALAGAMLGGRSGDVASLAFPLVALGLVAARVAWIFSRRVIGPDGELAAPAAWGRVGVYLGLISIIAVTGSLTLEGFILRGGSLWGMLGTWLESSLFGLLILGWIIAPLGAVVGLLMRAMFASFGAPR